MLFKIRCLTSVAGFLLVLCSGGCTKKHLQEIWAKGYKEVDVSLNTELWARTGYEKDKVYQLQTDVYLIREPDNDYNGQFPYAFTVPMNSRSCTKGVAMYHFPQIFEYHTDPDSWPDVVGTVSRGTNIQATLLTKVSTWNSMTGCIAEATILDGPLAGYTANLSDVTCRGNPWYPDPNIIPAKVE